MVKLKKLVYLLLLTYFVVEGLLDIRDAYSITINGIETELGTVVAINKFTSEFPELLYQFIKPIGKMTCWVLLIVAVRILLINANRYPNWVRICEACAVALVISPVCELSCEVLGKTLALIFKASNLDFEDSAVQTFILYSAEMIFFIFGTVVTFLLFKYGNKFKTEHLSDDTKWITKTIASSTRIKTTCSLYIVIGIAIYVSSAVI